INRESLAKIVVSQSVTAPQHRFGLRVQGPRKSDSRLKVVLIPVVQRFAPICWAGFVDRDQICEVGALFAGGDTFCEIFSQRDGGLGFKAMSFIDWAFEAVTQAEREGQIRLNLPCVLNVSVVRLRGKIPRSGRARYLQTAILGESESRRDF